MNVKTIAIGLTALLTAAAFSAPAETEAAPASGPEQHWYGYQTLLADCGALAIGIPSSGALVLPGYLLGGPLVHALHGEPMRALADFGLRVAMPLAAGSLAGGSYYLLTKENGLGLVAFTALGGIAGALGAISIDAALLGWDRIPAGMPPAAGAFSIRPTATVGSHTTFGVVGTF